MKNHTMSFSTLIIYDYMKDCAVHIESSESQKVAFSYPHNEETLWKFPVQDKYERSQM